MTPATRRAPSSCRARRARAPLLWRGGGDGGGGGGGCRGGAGRASPASLRSRRRQHGGQCAQVGGERGGERAHKARQGALLAERRDERRVAPRAARDAAVLQRVLVLIERRRVGGELCFGRRGGKADTHSSFAGPSGASGSSPGGSRWKSCPSTTSRANGINSGGGAAPAVSSNGWPSARSRYFPSSSSLRPSSAPSPSSDSSNGSVHSGPSAGALGAAATTAALGLRRRQRRLWRRWSGAALPNPQRRVAEVGGVDGDARATRQRPQRGAMACPWRRRG